jgi:hypothetical protein
MKKSILFSLVICFLIGTSLNAQRGGLLKKVTKSVTNELLGKPDAPTGNKSNQPEPACACDQAELVLELSGKLQLQYTEINISILNDGSFFIKDKISGKYYVSKDGVTRGPYSEGDAEISSFTNAESKDNSTNPLAIMFKDYISQSGDKFLITFNGKKYGPYARINSFVIPKSKDKFAAIVVENIVITSDQGKKMDEAIKNAKTDQEKMELAMKYSQEMNSKMMQGGGPASIMAKLVTSVEAAKFDPNAGGTLNAEMKYDDILVMGFNGISDLKGNKVISIKPEHSGSASVFVNTTNTKYAAYNYGTLSFSDGTTMSDLFSPHLVKSDGKVSLAYMYYSPKNNAIMQCKIPF